MPRSPIHIGIVAAALSALALVFAVLLRPFLEGAQCLPFLVAVWCCSWYAGRAGGYAATACSTILLTYADFWIQLTFNGEPTHAAARLAGFLALSLLISWSSATAQDGSTLLTATLTGIQDAVATIGPSGAVIFLNPAAETLTGWPASDAAGQPIGTVLDLLDEKTHQPLDNPFAALLRGQPLANPTEPRLLKTRSGAELPVELNAASVLDSRGGVRGGVIVFRDITARRQLEEQVTHAQKMDAVGRLAGGVAGDFNNVLTVITGYAELLREETAPTSPARRFADEVLYAAERAAALTRHLLTFSRRNSFHPRVCDLNALLHGMVPMLSRLLGQTIDLIFLPGPDLGRVNADPAQVEQVIVNLAANARDAMPTGGKLVIETTNVDLDEQPANSTVGVRPGSYVMIAVSDTGVGMDPETRSRVFEPFFTTKSPGKGSGLGLATVYGAIRQSEGQVTVYSQPGCGTIFEIYLPRVHNAIETTRTTSRRGGSETILLVDDEEGVRKLVAAVLQANGYDVLEAVDGVNAMAAWEKNGHKIDLVLTDVVMPQMNGFELGRELSGRTPEVKILYMSGYRDNPIGGSAGQEPRSFLHKPFTPDVLLARVREVIDGN